MRHHGLGRVFFCGMAVCWLAASAVAQPVRKVLIIGVDGMRPDAMLAANTPTFDALIANGAFSPNCLAEDITISGPGWSSILTGVHRTKHNVVDNGFAAPNYAQYPHFFRRLQDACNANTVSISQWAPINTIICGENADLVVSPTNGPGVAAACVQALASSNPDVIFLHFDDVDHAGHAYGFSPTVPQYLAAIQSVDGFAGEVLAAVGARPTYPNEDWLVIVTSDHGGTPDGTHGRNIPEHRLTGLIVSGASSARGTTISPDPQIVDVPATVMTFLGLTINPAWDWDGVAVGLDMAHSPSQPFACAPPPPPPTGACCLPGGGCAALTQSQCSEQRGVWQGLGAPCSGAGCITPDLLLSENFDAVPLGPNIDETIAGANVWSPLPPSGWMVDRSAMPTGGVKEWSGWSITDKAWWTQIAGDQGRSAFTKGAGAIAVADPDEWDDKPHAAGTFDSALVSPEIPLADSRPDSAYLTLDSSWVPEDSQSVRIDVRFDGGAPVRVLNWTSTSGPDFHGSAPNETIVVPLHNPAGAQSMSIALRMYDAGNDWWWGVDNVKVFAAPLHPRITLLQEDFEEVPLGPSVNEVIAGANVWSGSPPREWEFDDSGVFGINNPALGMTEWKGWAVTSRTWWTQIAEDQRRSEFTKGVGAVAVADPDEWDDRGSPSAQGAYNAVMYSPWVALDGLDLSTLLLGLDSSWRPEAPQRAELRAEFDAGAPQVLLNWSSVAGPTFHPDATNEHLSLPLPVPQGAVHVRLKFSLLDARNNWWWAVDNIELTARTGAPACDPDLNQDGNVDQGDVDYIVNVIAGGDNPSNADPDFNRDGNADQSDVDALINVIAGGGCP